MYFFLQYDLNSSFTFYDSTTPMRSSSPDLPSTCVPPHPKDFSSVCDLSEQRIDLNLISMLDSPVSEPPLSPHELDQQSRHMARTEVRGPIMPSPSHQATAVRNLYPFFVSQRPEVEFAPSPESSSSSFSLGFDLDTSSYPQCNSMGVQDLLLYNSNTMLDTNMDSGSVTDWVEKTLSEVISQNF